MKSARFLTTGILLVSAALCPLFGDSVEPEEPGIVLPPVFLEIEDLSEETIEAVLPEFDPEILPEPTLELPDAGEIDLSDEIFDIEPPDNRSGFIADSSSVSGASLFSEGTIGVGTQNSLIGDLSLYKLGPEPRFTMRFFHDSVDGYGPQSVGTAYFGSEDALDGSFEFNRDQLEFGVSAALSARDEGLQGNGSDFRSVSHRSLSGSVNAQLSPAERVTVAAGIGATSATQVLTSDTPSLDSEVTVTPSIDLEAVFGILTLSLDTMYTLTASDILPSTLHSGHAEAGILFEFPFGLDFGLFGGSIWESSDGFAFPFRATLDGTVGRVLGFRLEGGYTYQRPSLHALWNAYQLVDVPVSASEYGWYVAADLQWSFWDSLVLGTGARLSVMDQVLVRDEVPDPVTGLFSATAATDRVFFSPELELTWRPSESFSFAGVWSAQMLDTAGFEPELNIAFEASYEAVSGDYGFSADMDLSSYGLVQSPEVGVSGFYRVADGVHIDVAVEDILAALSNDERTVWGPYVPPGFRVLLATRISL